tara:strand:- start:10380 stop:11288 length:909 start_codon:yes stop_codon:yes gene_type:complete
MKLQEFNVQLLDTTSTIACFGKRHSGKTVLICDLMYNLHKYGGKKGIKPDLIIVFSATDEMQSNFSKFVPSGFIHQEFSESKLISILELQKSLKLKQGRCPCVVVIIDDMGFDRNVLNTPTIARIFSNGRHYNIMFIMSFQYVHQLPASLRANLDVTIALKEPIISNRKRLFQSLYGIMGSFKVFEKSFREVTNDYGAMISVSNGSSSNLIEKNIFWYKASLDVPDTFKAGRPVFWEWSKQYKLNQQHRSITNRNNSIVQVKKEDIRSRHSHHSQRAQQHNDTNSQRSHHAVNNAPPLSLIL